MSEGSLTSFAWIFMLTSMGSVTILMLYCYGRILRGGRPIGHEIGHEPEG